jgi:glycerol-3-phosphate acyltransferase PlsY
MRAIVVVLGSYLTSAIPVAYITARLLRGIDLRKHGSGNVGASNIWQSASKPAVVPVGLAEIAQGFAGPAAAIAGGHGPATQAAAGVAAVAGHNWSPFLGFTGGRGVAHAIGVMLALSRQALAVFIVVSLIGVRLKAVPQFVGLAILSAPLIARVTRQPGEIVAGLAAVAGLIFAKRLLANDGLPKHDRAAVLTNRLLYDRDARERDSWVSEGVARVEEG